MKKRANLVIVRPGSFEELEGVEIITIGNGRPGSGTVSFEHHLYRWPSIFSSLAILRKHIVANSRLADLLNKERLSCHRQARWFFGPRKMGGQVPGQVLFEHQVLCVALPGAILNQSKKWWPWHATYGKVVAEIHVHTELSYFTPSASMQMFKSYPKHAELLSTEFCWHIIGVLGTALWNLTSVSCSLHNLLG